MSDFSIFKGGRSTNSEIERKGDEALEIWRGLKTIKMKLIEKQTEKNSLSPTFLHPNMNIPTSSKIVSWSKSVSISAFARYLFG